MKDESYAEASAAALGRSFADMFKGMLEGGLSRREALDVLIAYVEALNAPKPPSPPTDVDP